MAHLISRPSSAFEVMAAAPIASEVVASEDMMLQYDDACEKEVRES